MCYDYFCDKCKKKYEIVKIVKDYNREEFCECGEEMAKVYSLASIKTGDGVKS